MSWVEDETFGEALQCGGVSAGLNLGAVGGVGAGGAFAVNIWMRFTSLPPTVIDDMRKYTPILDLNDAGGDDQIESVNTPNLLSITVGSRGLYRPPRICVFYNDEDDISGGMDSDEKCLGMGVPNLVRSPVICSDGSWELQAESPKQYWRIYPDYVPNVAPLGHGDLDDGEWHMVTFSTMPKGGAGFALYVDGVVTSTYPPLEIEGISVEELLQKPAFKVGGGGPSLRRAT